MLWSFEVKGFCIFLNKANHAVLLAIKAVVDDFKIFVQTFKNVLKYH